MEGRNQDCNSNWLDIVVLMMTENNVTPKLRRINESRFHMC